MFGNLSQLFDIKKKAEELKTKLEAMRIETIFHDIKIITNGNKRIVSLELPENFGNNLTNEQKEILIKDAVNTAIEDAGKKAEEEVKAIAGNMMPGLGGLFN